MEKYIIILIFIVILYFLFFCNTCDTIEKVDNTSTDDLLSKVTKSIQNLGDVAKNIQTVGLILPGKLTITNNTDISGKLNVTGPINFLPKGCVIAWSGIISEIPYGWALCDGLNGRPDLTGRFIVGVGQPTGDISANPNNLLFGTNGGEQQHKLTIPEIPRHQHTVPKTWGLPQGGDGGYSGKDSGVGGSSLCRPSGGGDQYHNNMPPYYVLYWIIKTI